MLPVLGAVLLLGIPLTHAASEPPEEELVRMWKQFCQAYHRSHSMDEEPRRFQAFRANVVRAQEMNLQQGVNCTDLFDGEACVFGMTKFMDFFPDEFAATSLGYRPAQRARARARVLPAEGLPAAPAAVDWRSKGAVTPVKNQGACGSCWAFSAVEAVESAVFMATGRLPVLSTQQIVACDKSDLGCNGGDTVTAYRYLERAGGLDTASDYPDTSSTSGRTGKCKWDHEEAAKVSGFAFATKPCGAGACRHQDEDALAKVVAAKGPVSICVNAGGAAWELYKRGIFSKKCQGGSSYLDHCVQIVGYSKTGRTPYWIVRNQWGTDWGMDGYMYLAMGRNLCGVADEATVPTVSVAGRHLLV